MTQTPEKIAAGLSRNVALADRIRERVWAICKAVPPIEPPAQHWLDSDAGASYCHPCAIKARAEEFGFGPPLQPDWWRRETKLEQAFWDGIDGGFDTESDVTEACETCGKTLSYILTDYGVEEELSYYLESPLVSVRDEDAYALDRLTLNIFSGSPRKRLLDAAIVVNHAWRIAVRVLISKEKDNG